MSRGVSHMYIVGQVTQEHAKQAMFVGSLSFLLLLSVTLQWNCSGARCEVSGTSSL